MVHCHCTLSLYTVTVHCPCTLSMLSLSTVTVHGTLYSGTVRCHCTLHTATAHCHYTLSLYIVTVHCTLYTVLCTLYSPRSHRMYPHTQYVRHNAQVVPSDHRGLWESTEEGTFLSVDFAKAYDNVSHAFFEAGMQYVGLPDDIIGLLVQSLFGEAQVCIDNGVAPDVSMTPQSGIRQGDPCPHQFLL